MKASVAHEFGPPEVLRFEDVPDPVAGPGRVVIAVAASSVTFIETMVRGGAARSRHIGRSCR